MNLYRPTKETGFIDPVDWEVVSLSDLVEVLKQEGAEEVGVQIDDWGVPVLGYGDTITQDAYDKEARYLVLRLGDTP